MLSKPMRALVKEITAESAAHATKTAMEFCERNLGTLPETHKAQHVMMTKMLPWLEGKQKREEWIYNLLVTVFTENVQTMLHWTVRILLFATLLGLSGGWSYFVSLWFKHVGT